MTKTYTVIAVSGNTNSFGLKSLMLLASDGTGLQLLQSAYGVNPLPRSGDELTLDRQKLAGLGYECPTTLRKTPAKEAKAIIAECLKTRQMRDNPQINACA